MKTRFLFGVLLTFNLFLPIGLTEVKAESNSNSDTLITKEAQAKSDTNPEIPVVDAQQWRTGKFKFPWSKVVMVDDDFDGKYLAVLERQRKRNKGLNIGAEAGIISEWSKTKIKVNFYYSVQQLFGKPRMSIGYAERIDLRVGDSVFKLEGNNGIFKITDEMAEAFANAPYEPVKLKMYPSEHEGNEYFTAFGEVILDIKKETVDAWKVVYEDKQVASE